MKFQHTATLALVGWYLMAPPYHVVLRQGTIAHFDIQFDAPISTWQIEDSFDSATQCAADRDRRGMSSMKDLPGLEAPKTLLQMQAVLDGQARCIATDDPRLKGN